jgi:hypothetical protein
MRSTVGLIVGLALGILLTYFVTSTFRVKGLADRQGNPEPGNTRDSAAGSDRSGERRLLAERLGRALAQHLRRTLAEGDTVVLLHANPDLPDAATAEEAVRRSIRTAGQLRLVEVQRPEELDDGARQAQALVCADHDRMRQLADDAGGRLPPLYTLGWSQWLLTACAADPPALTAVALVVPAHAVHRHTPVMSRRDGQDPCTETEAPGPLILSAAEVEALFGTPGPVAPAAGEPLDAPPAPGETTP